MARSPWLEFPDDFKPEPTVYNGGPVRQKQIWEACRRVNDGGYGSGVVQSISSMGCKPNRAKVTSCSPFTATVIGMMFDPRPGVAQSNFEPRYDQGRRTLSTAFYQMHNGNYFAIDNSTAADLKRTTERSRARFKQWAESRWPTPAKSWDDSAMSLVWHNLGYQIDPRDMRRGDLVGIDWSPTNGGHAVFAWDVHLDAAGAVDCFTFVSSNGTTARGGAGISVYCGSWPRLWNRDGNGAFSFKLGTTVFDDYDEYIQYGAWHCLPGKTRGDIDTKTFKKTPTTIIDPSSWHPKLGYSEYVGSLRVVRFWGVAPPASPHGTLLGDNAGKAGELRKWAAPEPVCMGSSSPPGRIEKVQPVPVPKTHPEPIKAAPPKPAPPQKPAHVVPHQHFVEDALAELYAHRWIDVHPGDPSSVGDPKTKTAVENFQYKFNVPPIDGIAGRKTRPALERALADLRAGKPNPSRPPPALAIERFYWLSNRVAPGGAAGLAIASPDRSRFQDFELSLTDQARITVTMALPALGARGACSVTIPATFPAGSVLTGHLRGTAGGARVEKSTAVPLYVGAVSRSSEDEWPWDEAKWTHYMRGVVAELRAAHKGRGALAQREIAQYGVKDSLEPGDVQILGLVGKNVVPLPLPPVGKLGLYLADIEGTLRWHGRMLNIVKSGNVYDKPVTRVIGGKTVTKMKPTFEKFDPSKSIWVDVTDQHPWGSGARMPLIPFRVLAHNAATEIPLYGRIVYIQQLDGLTLPTGERHNGMCVVGDQGGMRPPGKQFDFFVGRMAQPLAIPSLGSSQGGSVCNVEILGMSTAYARPHR